MRPEKNPLDLNNLPEDSTRDGRQALEDSSTNTAAGVVKEAKNDCGNKVYECRFCSLKFCKSQALGGHMNRHRQERETETLNRARQLVYNNDNLIAQGVHPLGGQPITHGGFHHHAAGLGDPTISFRPAYPTRLFPAPAPPLLPPQPVTPLGGQPPHQPYMYASPPCLIPFPSQYPPHQGNDYIIGHALTGTTSPNYVSAPSDTN